MFLLANNLGDAWNSSLKIPFARLLFFFLYYQYSTPPTSSPMTFFPSEHHRRKRALGTRLIRYCKHVERDMRRYVRFILNSSNCTVPQELGFAHNKKCFAYFPTD